MMIRPFVRFAALALLASAPAGIAHSQASAASAPKPGMTVKDASGGTVGTVVKVDGSTVTIKTDKYEIPLAASSFTINGNALLFGMSPAQLDAEYEKGLAAAQASLQVGQPVKGAAGTVIGTIEAIDESNVTIKLSGSDQKVVLPRGGIAGAATGATIGLTDEQLKAAIASAKKQ